jgi:hypothetical protein
MKALLDRVLRRRALHIFVRLRPHLPHEGRLLDVGSGTGHNAAAIESLTGLHVTKLDVTDMNVVGRPVALYDGEHLPFDGQTFRATLALFILHYVSEPVSFLRELQRAGGGRCLMVQSVYTTSFGGQVLKIREFIQGRAAFLVARSLAFVPRGRCTMRPLRFYTREELASVFERAGLEIVAHTRSPWIVLGVSRDLYVLQSRCTP